MPLIGENVWIYSGAIVLGPITVGDNAVIGAGSVVPSSWFAEKVDLREKKVFIREGNDLIEYPMLSDSVHNAFNVLASIALLRSVRSNTNRILKSIQSSKYFSF